MIIAAGQENANWRDKKALAQRPYIVFSAFSLHRVNSRGHLESDPSNEELRSRLGFSHVSRQCLREVVILVAAIERNRKGETPPVHYSATEQGHSITSFGLRHDDSCPIPILQFILN